MAKLNLSILLIFGVLAGSVMSACEYKYGDSQYSGGCYNNCKDYATLSAAKAACDNDVNCKGITYSYKSIGGSSATNAIGNGWGYQLRATASGAKSPNKENSWLKGTCPDPQTPNDPCDFKPSQGTYLSGCSLNCKDYSTLSAAQAACRLEPTCAGVTFSRKDIGGSATTNAFDGVWGFQLRVGGTPIDSPNGENSWVRSSCPTSNVNGSYCGYTKQSYRDISALLNGPAYTTEAQALSACDGNGNCQGVVQKDGNFYLTSLSASAASAYNYVSYSKGVCNVVTYPILFTECNFGGEQLPVKSNISSIELKKYKSLYVPAGQYVKFHSLENYQGTSTENKASIYCNNNGFIAFLQYRSKNVASVEVGRISNLSKKLKLNQ